MAYAFFTLGHSTRSLDDFVALLESAAIGLVADVRTVPRSRTNPQFDKASLPTELAKCAIRYEHIAQLGGLRGKRTGAESLNAFWHNQSFRNYADYALTSPFREGLDVLLQLGQTQRCAIMCAEAVWWRCHRRIIADYLLTAGQTVCHIMGPGQIHPATLTPAAQPDANGSLVYPANGAPKFDDRAAPLPTSS